mgnify:CR=1 FL=1
MPMKPMKPMAVALGLWLLIFVIVTFSLIYDASIFFNATVYLIFATVLVSVFSIVLQQQNRLGELSARIKSLEDTVSELMTFLLKKEGDKNG